MEERGGSEHHAGELSELHTAILKLLAEGNSSAQTARALSVSEATMRRNLQEARDVLGAVSTQHAIYIAAKRGLI